MTRGSVELCKSLGASARLLFTITAIAWVGMIFMCFSLNTGSKLAGPIALATYLLVIALFMCIFGPVIAWLQSHHEKPYLGIKLLTGIMVLVIAGYFGTA